MAVGDDKNITTCTLDAVDVSLVILLNLLSMLANCPSLCGGAGIAPRLVDDTVYAFRHLVNAFTILSWATGRYGGSAKRAPYRHQVLTSNQPIVPDSPGWFELLDL